MTANPASARPHGPAPRQKEAAAQRSRGTYRRQLTADCPQAPHIGPEARRAAALVLEVLAGVRTPAGAATALGIRLPRYYLLEQRAIRGLIWACEPRPVGRTVSTDRRLARLERELSVSRRELARHQALARTTQRAVGAGAGGQQNAGSVKRNQTAAAETVRASTPCRAVAANRGFTWQGRAGCGTRTRWETPCGGARWRWESTSGVGDDPLRRAGRSRRVYPCRPAESH